jgi:hypothetical protein
MAFNIIDVSHTCGLHIIGLGRARFNLSCTKHGYGVVPVC